MHIRRLAAPVALSAAALLAAGGGVLAASPASAAPNAIVDQSLQANTPFDTNSVALGTPSATALTATTTSTSVGVRCAGLFMGGQPLSVSPANQGGLSATLVSAPATCDSSTLNVAKTVPVLTDGTYQFTVSASPNPGHNATESAVETVVVSGNPVAPAITQAWTESVSLTSPPNTVLPNIQFSGTDVRDCVGYVSETGGVLPPGALADPCSYTGNTANHALSAPLSGTWSADSLPGSLNFSNPGSGLLVPGGSGCGSSSCTYNYATVSGSEGGAAASETFNLTVLTSRVIVQSNIGDYVNKYGNGIDVYQQNYAANHLITGWTATKGDPATHFVRYTNVNGGYSLEAVRADGIASGLCVSDPVGSEPAGFVPGQLTLRGCNGSVFQGFNQSTANGALNSDVAGAGHVEPNGTGAPLVVTTAFDGWGGYVYNWLDLNQLP